MDNMKKLDILLNLQDKYGDSLLDPEKCKGIYQNLVEKKRNILVKLNSDTPTYPIGKLEKINREILEKFNEIHECSEIVNKSLLSDLTHINGIKEQFQIHNDDLNTLQSLKKYLKVLQRIEYFNIELEKEYRNDDYEKCITIYANFCEISWNCTSLENSHLTRILNDIIHYWHEILKEKLSKDFNQLLENIKWPYVNTNINLQPLTSNQIEKLKLFTEYLLQIELPDKVTSLISLSIDVSNLCLPVYFLIQPLRKRFVFHFYGSRKTNRIDKPEWYFTQIITWIRDHQNFIQTYIQPVVDKLGFYHIDAECEFSVGLVQLGVEKLQSDLPKVQYDDFTFSHTLDEALSFDKELRDSYDYPPSQMGVLGVLTQPQVFIKWLTMEKKFAVEKMDKILSTQPFEYQNEETKVTFCADAFMTLLKRITERSETLSQPGHRLQFLDLQLELLDDFRVRLIQIANAEEGNVIESKVPMIVNTLFYIEYVLDDWGNTLHFLNLFFYKNQNIENKETSCAETNIFSEALYLFNHLRKDLLSTLCDFITNEVKMKARNYRCENWSKIRINKNDELSLTQSACQMFEIINKRLYQLKNNLNAKLFVTVWKSVAQQIDTLLFEDLILDNKFNEDGSKQLRYDIEKNLLPLFSQFTDKASNHFKQLQESIILLNLSKGSAILLKEMLTQLESATGIEDTRTKILKDVGIINFAPNVAVIVLNRRIDLYSDDISID